MFVGIIIGLPVLACICCIIAEMVRHRASKKHQPKEVRQAAATSPENKEVEESPESKELSEEIKVELSKEVENKNVPTDFDNVKKESASNKTKKDNKGKEEEMEMTLKK